MNQRDWQTNSRRRGDMVVTLNKSRLRFFAGLVLILIIAAFGLGYQWGKSAGRRESSPLAVPPPPSLAPPAEVAAMPERAAETTEEAPAPPRATTTVAPRQPAAAPRRPAATTTVPAATRDTRSAPETRYPRYAIVVKSVPIEGDAGSAKAEAERAVAQLRTKGFRQAHTEKVTIPGRGDYYRVIALEAEYPTPATARRDIEAMKRRGEISTGFPLRLEEH